MVRRAADLARIPTSRPEQVRLYGRAVEQVLQDLSTELSCRRAELIARIISLLKEAKKRGVDSGNDMNVRAMQATLPLMTASVSVWVARVAMKRLYPSFEKQVGAAVDGLRDIKYGKGNGRPEPPNTRMDV